MEGVYGWTLAAGTLTLEVIEDDCPFSQLRQRFLELTSWLAEA
jgi:hypothetical protein